MQNLVPLGTGNSRFMKSNIPASTTHEQLIQMLNAGTFPYDIGTLNQAGISQAGTPLNKDTLLKDDTAALYGLGSEAVPDEVLAMLAGSVQLNEERVQTTQYKSLGSLPVGAVLKIEESPGAETVPYVVLHQGKPSDLYDASCEGTWLIRAKVNAATLSWNGSTGAGWYDTCDLNSYLNETYFPSMPEWFRSAAKRVKIPYGEYDNGWKVNSGANGVQVNSFALSVFEVSTTERLYTKDGDQLSFFKERSFSDLGITNSTWSRTMDTTHTGSYAGSFANSGAVTERLVTGKVFTCPVTILNSDTMLYIDEDGTVQQEEKYKTEYMLKDPRGERVEDKVRDLVSSVYKLKEITTTQTAQQVSVDVSDIDFDAYDEVIVYVEFENATKSSSPTPYCYVQVNGVDDASEERYGYWGDDRFTSTQFVDDSFAYLAYIAAVSDKTRYQCRAAKLRFQKRGQYLFCQSEYGYYQIESKQFYSRTEAGLFRLLDDPSVTSLQFVSGNTSDCTIKSGGKLRFLGVKK